MPTLLILRHAAAHPSAVRDHKRPLTDQGRRDAAVVGRALAVAQAPDQALISSARRAYETFTIARDHGGWSADAHVLDDLYGGDPHAIIATVGAHATTTGTLLIVGHEPSCSGLIELLTGARTRMPAAAVACLQAAPSWDALDPQWCTLQWFASPRVLSGLQAPFRT